MEKKDNWMGQKYIYRKNEPNLVMDYVLEMRKKKESVTVSRLKA